MTSRLVALIGNPNSGKTTLFNSLTGREQEIGNWCGVTVEKKRGWFQYQKVLVEVLDLPGCYQCLPTVENAMDERITAEYIASNEAELIINVVDATNLERQLHLTLQLLERGLSIIVALNMMDAAKRQGIKIDINKLAQQLGCPVVPLVAAKNLGIEDLKKVIVTCNRVTHKAKGQPEAFTAPTPPLSPTLSIQSTQSKVATANSNCFAEGAVAERAARIISEDVALAKERHARIAKVLQSSVQRSRTSKPNWTERIDKIVLNRFLGIPIFMVAMYLVFIFTIYLGGIFQDLFDSGSKAIFVEGISKALAYVQAPDWLNYIMALGVGQGINTTISFIPVIASMFLSLSFLEASGYMARVAFVMDKVMQWVGLPGKSFVPMILGFGCNVPAVMATRTLGNERERILTILMSPFMSCGARLAIYALFVSAFFPVGGQNIIFGLYIVGILIALLTGFVLRTTVLSGERSTLIIELPPYRWPSFRGIGKTTWQRLKRFILKAGMMIVLLSVVMGGLGTIQDKRGHSWIAKVGRYLTPAFAPMGIEENNWPATVGLLTGILAKEVVVGTLSALYVQEDHRAGGNTVIQETVASDGVLGLMVKRFGSSAAAFAYLLFVLLYFPCVSVVATMARELNGYWAMFSVVWTTSIAYITAVLFYQAAIIGVKPTTSIAWIIGMATLLALGFYGVRKFMQFRASLRVKRLLPTQLLILEN